MPDPPTPHRPGDIFCPERGEWTKFAPRDAAKTLLQEPAPPKDFEVLEVSIAAP